MKTEIQETELYKKFKEALNIQDMRADDNPYIVECCKIAKEYATQQPTAEGAVRHLTDDEIEKHGMEGGLRDGELQMYWEGATWYRSYAQKIADKMVEEMLREEWVKASDKLPKEHSQVLCYNGFRISQHSWKQYTDQNADWFKKTFTHWRELPKLP